MSINLSLKTHRKKNLFFLFFVLSVFSKLSSAIFTVTNSSGALIPGSLFQAVQDANVNPGLDTIRFNVSLNGRLVITFSSALNITDPIFIDGTSQPGYSTPPNDPWVLFRTSNLGGASSFISLGAGSGGSTIRGINIGGAPFTGVSISSSNNTIQNCWFGLDSLGTSPNTMIAGIYIDIGARNNHIGGVGSANRNYFSSCDNGMVIKGNTNTVEGNYFGTDVTGLISLANNMSAINIVNADSNVIGSAVEGNFISGNTNAYGIYANNTKGLKIAGNYIGLAALSYTVLPNSTGIFLINSSNCTIGGDMIGERNYIGGNSAVGLILSQPCDSIFVYGNSFGISPNNTEVLNGSNINSSFSSNIYIGDSVISRRNYFSNCSFQGLSIYDGNKFFIAGNFFGLDFNGNALGNKNGNHLYFSNTSNSYIGGSSSNFRNVFANSQSALRISGGTQIQISKNFIGTDTTGSLAIPNDVGVILQNGVSETFFKENLISGNTFYGVNIEPTANNNHYFYGNLIGVNNEGNAGLGNSIGIYSSKKLYVGSSNNADANIISGNFSYGIDLYGDSSVIQGNLIGVGKDSLQAIPNSGGIQVTANYVTIGGLLNGQGNIIANNFSNAVFVSNALGNNLSNARIIGNSTYNNGGSCGFSINIPDTAAFGISTNDPLDTDTFPNRGQNFPIIKCVSNYVDTAIAMVQFEFNSEPNKLYMLEFFLDSIGCNFRGEGQYFLNRIFINTDSNGNYFDSIPIPSQNFSGMVISATATDTANFATSEFSPSSGLFDVSYTNLGSIDCFGDSTYVGVTVYNNSGNFTYNWQPGSVLDVGSGFALVPAGSYTCYVIDDNSCRAASPVINVLSPAPFVVTVTATPSVCGGSTGSATANVSGGTTPYFYKMWSSGDSSLVTSNLQAGPYLFQAYDANGCFATAGVFVENLTAPTISPVAIQNVNCFGGSDGSIDVALSGGSAPYQVNWSTNATSEDISNLTAGFYEVNVSDNNGCISYYATTVNEPSPLTISLTAFNDPSACGLNDGSLTVVANGGAGNYLYQWDSNANFQSTATATALSAGYFSVQVSDLHGCTETNFFTLQDINAPILKIDSFVNAGCLIAGGNGAIYTSVLSGSGNYAYQWNNGSATDDINGLNVGNYALTVTDQINNCKSSIVKNIIGQRPGTANICLISVDTATNHNIIAWNDTVSGIADYKIFRENSIAGNYNLIATILSGTTNYFEDSLANSELRSWRYKIQTTDSCGRISTYSLAEKTIHTSVTVESGGFRLNWDPYFDSNFNFFYYKIFRKLQDSSAYRLIDSVPFYALPTYLDLSSPVPTDSNFYFVELDNDAPCSASVQRISNDPQNLFGTIVKTRSNVKNNRLAGTGIGIYQADAVTLFPNPANNFISFSLSNNIQIESVEILDVLGRCVLDKKEYSHNEFELPVSKLPDGIYYAVITSDGKKITKRFIIAR